MNRTKYRLAMSGLVALSAVGVAGLVLAMRTTSPAPHGPSAPDTVNPRALLTSSSATATAPIEGVAGGHFRGLGVVPADLRAQGWDHVGDPDVTATGGTLDAYQRGDGAAKLFALTAADGQRLDFAHPLAKGEALNNSFATVSPDQHWIVSGEWGVMHRLLVFPLPSESTDALPLVSTIRLDVPVDRIQGCDFASTLRLYCAAGAPNTTPGHVVAIELAGPVGAESVDGHVVNLGRVVPSSSCKGPIEVEGVDVTGGVLTVTANNPLPCYSQAASVYRYRIG